MKHKYYFNIKMKTALFFLNGKFCLPFCIYYIKKFFSKNLIYCVDGSVNKLQKSSYLINKVKLIIGDNDSFLNQNNINYHFIYDQNLTDFEKSLKFILKSNYQKIIVFGAEGGELDHYLSNISTIIKYKDKINIFMIDRYHISFLLPKKKFYLNDMKQRKISILPLFNINKISLTGCKFNFKNINLIFGDKISVRNYGLDNKIKIEYSSGTGILFLSNSKVNNKDNSKEKNSIYNFNLLNNITN